LQCELETDSINIFFIAVDVLVGIAVVNLLLFTASDVTINVGLWEKNKYKQTREETNK